MVLSDFFYKCSVELFHEFKNITLGSMKLYVIGSLLQHKLDNMLRIMFIVAVSFGLIVVPQLRRIVFTELDFLMVFFAVIILMVISSISVSITFFYLMKLNGKSMIRHKNVIKMLSEVSKLPKALSRQRKDVFASHGNQKTFFLRVDC